MQDGRVTESGSYEDLSSRVDSSFAMWLKEELNIEEQKEKERAARARLDSESAPLAVVSTSFDTDNRECGVSMT